MAARQTILVFDSGLGGLTVYREVAAARPDADFVYVADDAAFPYGALAEPALVARVVGLMGELIAAHRPDLVVIACNTASTIVLPALRKKFAVPFVGTVPAIKPACAASVTKRVSVLGTEATVKREYTRALIRDYAQGCEVTLVGAKALAGLRGGGTARRAGRRCRVARGDRALFPRRRRAHRYGRAGLHPLSAADRAVAAARALAGEFHRSGAGDRAARRRSSRAGAAAASSRHDARHFHVRPRTASRARTLSHPLAEPAASAVR